MIKGEKRKMTEEEKNNVKEFQESGLLWFINLILHLFGWCLVVEKKNWKIFSFYPKRTAFRGFTEKDNADGYIKVSEYLVKHAKELLEESKE